MEDHLLDRIETKEIELEVVDAYSEANYLLKTIVLVEDGLYMNTYMVDQEGLNVFFQSYGDHAEFVIELKRVEG